METVKKDEVEIIRMQIMVWFLLFSLTIISGIFIEYGPIFFLIAFMTNWVYTCAMISNLIEFYTGEEN